jgi:hypothetical protein
MYGVARPVCRLTTSSDKDGFALAIEGLGRRDARIALLMVRLDLGGSERRHVLDIHKDLVTHICWSVRRPISLLEILGLSAVIDKMSDSV